MTKNVCDIKKFFPFEIKHFLRVLRRIFGLIFSGLGTVYLFAGVHSKIPNSGVLFLPAAVFIVCGICLLAKPFD